MIGNDLMNQGYDGTHCCSDCQKVHQVGIEKCPCDCHWTANEEIEFYKFREKGGELIDI